MVKEIWDGFGTLDTAGVHGILFAAVIHSDSSRYFPIYSDGVRQKKKTTFTAANLYAAISITLFTLGRHISSCMGGSLRSGGGKDLDSSRTYHCGGGQRKHGCEDDNCA